MTIKEVLDHFGSGRQVCLALDIKAPNWTQWQKKGTIPYGRQCELEIITKGALKASKDD